MSARPQRGADRKRSRFTHNQQVVSDWFSGEEQGHDVEAPRELLASVGVAELYEDPYSAEPGKDVSFDGLPVTVKQTMLDTLVSFAPTIRKRTITAARDPTAIVLPANHRHDAVVVPERARTVAGAGGGALDAVNNAHRASLTALPEYDGIEMLFAQLEMQAADASVRMSVQDLVDVIDSGHVHTVHAPGGRDPHVFVVFDVDDRATFFCAAALRCYRGGGASAAAAVHEECTPWSAAERERLGKIAGAFVGHAYFECPCVCKN
jgi:hypothetical protein